MREPVGARARPRSGTFLRYALPGLLATLLGLVAMVPSVFWIARDRAIWPWDPAWYGQVSYDLFAALRGPSLDWDAQMVGAFGIKPPGVAWLGQFFVPLGGIFGDQDALLVSILLTQAASVALMCLAARRLGGSGALPGVAAALALAGAPLFVALSHDYFAEPIQTLSVVWVLAIMAYARSIRPSVTVIQLVAAISLGLLAKLATPVYMAAPVVVALVGVALVVRERRVFSPFFRDARVLASGALAAPLVLGVLAWYRENFTAALEQGRAARESTLYGTSDGFLTELPLWARRLEDAAFAPYFDLLVIGLLGLGAAALLLRGSSRWRLQALYPALCVGACVVTVAVILIPYSLSANDDIRYLMPLVPCAALVLGILLGALRSRVVAVAIIAALGAQLVLVNLLTLGSIESRTFGWYRLVEPAPASAFADELRRIARTTCTPETNGKISMVGVEYPWLNQNTLTLLAHERYVQSGRVCYFTALGYAEQSAAVALKRLREFAPPYFVGLDDGNPANRLPAANALSIRPDDPFNVVNRAVKRAITRSGEYMVVPGSRRLGMIVYRRAAEAG